MRKTSVKHHLRKCKKKVVPVRKHSRKTKRKNRGMALTKPEYKRAVAKIKPNLTTIKALFPGKRPMVVDFMKNKEGTHLLAVIEKSYPDSLLKERVKKNKSQIQRLPFNKELDLIAILNPPEPELIKGFEKPVKWKPIKFSTDLKKEAEKFAKKYNRLKPNDKITAEDIIKEGRKDEKKV